MKKFLLIGLIVSVVLILAGGAGLVYARVSNLEPNVTVTLNPGQNGALPFGYGPGGMLNGYGYGPGGMMGRRGICLDLGPSALQPYVISAFANAVGLTVDQVNTRLANGETLNQIAIAQGKTQADLPTLVSQVYKAALDKAVADGVITQTQEDQLLKVIDNISGQGFGFGFGFGCNIRHMWGGIEYR